MTTALDLDTATPEEIARWAAQPIIARRLVVSPRDLEVMEYGERRSDPIESDLQACDLRETDEPGWREYAGAAVFCALFLVAWCWVAALS